MTSFEVDPERHAAAQRVPEARRLRARPAAAGRDRRPRRPSRTAVFDLAFIDGPKAGYETHLDEAVRLLRPGGLLLVDNVLMGGGAATGEPTNQWGAGLGRR